MLRLLLAHVGINPDRVKLDWVSSSEANRFAEVVRNFTEQVRALARWKREGRRKMERLDLLRDAVKSLLDSGQVDGCWRCGLPGRNPRRTCSARATM